MHFKLEVKRPALTAEGKNLHVFDVEVVSEHSQDVLVAYLVDLKTRGR